MVNLKNAKESAANLEKSVQNRIAELNKILETRDHEIIQIGKKIMKIENSLDDTTEKLEAATVGLEDAEQQKLWRFKERPLRVNHLSMTSAWTRWRNKLKLPAKWHSDLLEMQRKSQENLL